MVNLKYIEFQPVLQKIQGRLKSQTHPSVVSCDTALVIVIKNLSVERTLAFAVNLALSFSLLRAHAHACALSLFLSPSTCLSRAHALSLSPHFLAYFLSRAFSDYLSTRCRTRSVELTIFMSWSLVKTVSLLSIVFFSVLQSIFFSLGK